ncbi:AMP-binding protein [Lishizhenia sp.]|uniref:AMP-binding protein n=1 Tax=Lishizhenia sp. TaxID=2497594 RepID=UPI00299DEBED|nr:AMP-binding protein [Lishizhenia sp.]MDX1446425.1 AMP-binding protein [Lishizhenia sp.]
MEIKVLEGGEVSFSLVEEFLEEWNNDKDYIVQFTSGSTGKPKPIKVLKKHMIASAKTTNTFFKLTKESKYYLCISPAYIGGKMMIVRALINDAYLWVGPINSKAITPLQEKVDLAAMVPLQVETCMKDDAFQLINHLIIGGAPVNDNLAKELINSQVNAYSTFGMTETVSHIALKYLGKENQFFKVLPPSEITVNENHQLIINAPHLGVENMLTNDIITLHDHQSFEWLGRADFTINSGGVKLQPEIIEKKLVTFLSKHAFIICGVKNDTFGEAVSLCIEGKPDNIEQIKTAMRSTLEKYEIPKFIYYLPELSRTANGKINRLETKERIELEGVLL